MILTLDGAATTSPEGTALLRKLGEIIGGTEAVMIGGGVAVGLRDHYLAATGLPSKLAQADIAYHHNSKNGFMVEGRFPKVAKGFAAKLHGRWIFRLSMLFIMEARLRRKTWKSCKNAWRPA